MKAKRLISTLLVLILIVSTISAVGIVSANAAAPSITIKAVTNLTNNNAQINATVNNPSKAKITKVGFQLGTKSGSWSTTKSESLNRTNGFSVWYSMNKWYGKLKSNQTYYYRFFITTGGKNKYSSIGSFKTKSDIPTITVNGVTNKTHNNAQINAKVSNPYKVKVTKVGFQIGTKSGTWLATKSESINKTTDFTTWYLMSKWYGTLKASTTYYYRFFITVGGKNYYSSIKSFKTDPVPPTTIKPTEICFPLSKNQVWFASTYKNKDGSYHGSALASTFSSVDIKLKNGKSAEGYAVYAAEGGKVISWVKNNGQIVIEHTKTLITTNGKKYTKWYTLYAHMKNIKVKVGNTVKRGQQIGQVSMVGKATGPHLHFNIISGNGNTKWDQNTNKKKAISPYYVYGFVNKNGSNTKYCVCDRSGPVVKDTLINWKPTGV